MRRKIKEAKNSWLASQCREVEELHVKYDVLNYYKKLKKDYQYLQEDKQLKNYKK